MEILESIYKEFIAFFGVTQVWEILSSGDYSSFRTFDGIVALLAPIIPFLLVIEFVAGVIHKKPHMKIYKVNFLIYFFNRVLFLVISLATITFIIGLLQPYALWQTTPVWYWFIYAYLVWDLGHFIYHYFGHKVRLFWCLHSTHHAPETMNLTVNFAHFFLEYPYADVIRTSVCILLGVSPEMLFIIMFIDGTWGAFIHLGENVLKDGRLGFLNKIILTPSHHRVHHAKNPLYLDTNYCNLFNVWDRIFGTYQEERMDIQIEYGITREVKSGSFWDAYFGEIVELVKDVSKAPGLKNKFLYVFMPPGWSHTGDHQTAKIARQEFLNNESRMTAQVEK